MPNKLDKTHYNKRVVSVKPTSIATYQGVFAAVIGLAAAILFSLRNSLDIAQSTESLLAGLTLGIVSGALAIFVVPLIYFGIGWLIGLMQGLVLNFLIEASDGIEVRLEDNLK
jgi:hypothetical protein